LLTAALLWNNGPVAAQVAHYDANDQVLTTILNVTDGPATVTYNLATEDLIPKLLARWKELLSDVLERDSEYFWDEAETAMEEELANGESPFAQYGPVLLLAEREHFIHQQGDAKVGDVTLINGVHNGPAATEDRCVMFITTGVAGSDAKYDDNSQWTQPQLMLSLSRAAAVARMGRNSAHHQAVWKYLVKHYFKINQSEATWVQWTDYFYSISPDHPEDDSVLQDMYAWENEAKGEWLDEELNRRKLKKRAKNETNQSVEKRLAAAK